MIAAIVAAAGRSTRMGRPKLLLPFDGRALITHVVSALREGGADRVLVVAPPANSEEGPAVALAAKDAGAYVIMPDVRPAEMRDSIEIGLSAAAEPAAPPRLVLLSPGDAPGITPPGRPRGSSKRAAVSRKRSWCHVAAARRGASARAPVGNSLAKLFLCPRGRGSTHSWRHQPYCSRCPLATLTSRTTSTARKTSSAGKSDWASSPTSRTRVPECG